MLDRILQLLTGVVDFLTKHVGTWQYGPISTVISARMTRKPRGLVLSEQLTVPAVRFCNTPMKKPKWRMTMKKLMMTVALVACASPSLAGSSVESINCRYSRFYGYSNCRTTFTEIPDPVRNLEQEKLDATARQREDEKWEAFCKPTFKADEFGVRRASYAKRGCEFGLSE